VFGSVTCTSWRVPPLSRWTIASIHVPTLVISRRDSLLVSPDQGRYVADHIAGARFVELPGSDYWLFSEHADALVDQIVEFITGVRPVGSHDRVLATVLFTDIVGSTEQASSRGDKAWTAVLDKHDDVIERELARDRDRRVSPTGDGILATFDGPAGVQCAHAIIEAVRPLGIEARAGLPIGEVELRGDDIGGIAVHVGQRISALAASGEVLVSRTVTDLVPGSGLEFEDRGERALKGVPGTWRLFAVNG
jgi:class 3 adenylate cyclase